MIGWFRSQSRGRRAVRSQSLIAALAALAVVLLVPPLVGAVAGDQDTAQLRGLKILVPNAPGGGYDVTARTAAKALEDAGITGSVEVFNLPGAGGHRRARPHGQRERQRPPRHVHGAGRGGQRVHQQLAGHAGRRHPDRPADPGDRGRGGRQGLPAAHHARPGRGLEGGPGRYPGGRRLLPRRSGSPGPDAHRGGRRDRPAGGQLRGLRRRRRAVGRGARRPRWRSGCPGWASTRTRSPRGSCGCSR